jgi:hypothetical protein
MRQMGSPCSTSTVSGRVRHSPRPCSCNTFSDHRWPCAGRVERHAHIGRSANVCVPPNTQKTTPGTSSAWFLQPRHGVFSIKRACSGWACRGARAEICAMLYSRKTRNCTCVCRIQSQCDDSRYDMGDHANVRAIDCEPTASAFAAGHCNEPGR